MKFIKKKNLQEGEELLFVPEQHWMYAVRHLFLALPFLVILFIMWRSLANQPGAGMIGVFPLSARMVGNLFWSLLIADLAVCVFRTVSFLSTEYGVTNKRLIMKRGVVSLNVAEISIDRIESIYCRRGLFGRIFRYGTIVVGGVGGKVPQFYMVRRPFALRRKIVDILEKNKTVTVVHGELPRAPSPLPPLAEEPEKEPIYRYGTFVQVLQQ